jgi:hypothetical protein
LLDEHHQGLADYQRKVVARNYDLGVPLLVEGGAFHLLELDHHHLHAHHYV